MRSAYLTNSIAYLLTDRLPCVHLSKSFLRRSFALMSSKLALDPGKEPFESEPLLDCRPLLLGESLGGLSLESPSLDCPCLLGMASQAVGGIEIFSRSFVNECRSSSKPTESRTSLTHCRADSSSTLPSYLLGGLTGTLFAFEGMFRRTSNSARICRIVSRSIATSFKADASLDANPRLGLCIEPCTPSPLKGWVFIESRLD